VALRGCLLLNCLFKLHVCLLLNGLRVLQFFNELHLKQLHLHNLLFLCCNDSLLLLNLALDLNSCFNNPAAFRLFHLLFGNLLLYTHLLLHIMVPLGPELHILIVAGPVFHCLNFSFVGLLLTMHLNGRLDLLLFLFVRYFRVLVTINILLMFELIHLHAIDFALHFFVVALLKTHNFSSTLLCFFNLLPGAHLLLLQKGDTVG